MYKKPRKLPNSITPAPKEAPPPPPFPIPKPRARASRPGQRAPRRAAQAQALAAAQATAQEAAQEAAQVVTQAEARAQAPEAAQEAARAATQTEAQVVTAEDVVQQQLPTVLGVNTATGLETGCAAAANGLVGDMGGLPQPQEPALSGEPITYTARMCEAVAAGSGGGDGGDAACLAAGGGDGGDAACLTAGGGDGGDGGDAACLTAGGGDGGDAAWLTADGASLTNATTSATAAPGLVDRAPWDEHLYRRFLANMHSAQVNGDGVRPAAVMFDPQPSSGGHTLEQQGPPTGGTFGTTASVPGMDRRAAAGLQPLGGSDGRQRTATAASSGGGGGAAAGSAGGRSDGGGAYGGASGVNHPERPPGGAAPKGREPAFHTLPIRERVDKLSSEQGTRQSKYRRELLKRSREELSRQQQQHADRGDVAGVGQDGGRGGRGGRSGADARRTLEQAALDSKVQEYARKETCRSIKYMKNYASTFTAVVRRADVLLYGCSRASTKSHLHATGQLLDALADGERRELAKMLDAFVQLPELRPHLLRAWRQVAEAHGARVSDAMDEGSDAMDPDDEDGDEAASEDAEEGLQPGGQPQGRRHGAAAPKAPRQRKTGGRTAAAAATTMVPQPANGPPLDGWRVGAAAAAAAALPHAAAVPQTAGGRTAAAAAATVIPQPANVPPLDGWRVAAAAAATAALPHAAAVPPTAATRRDDDGDRGTEDHADGGADGDWNPQRKRQRL